MPLSAHQQKAGLFFLTIAVLSMGIITPLAALPEWIGNIIGNRIPENFSVYWNQVTPENVMQWDAVESTRDNMNWGPADNCYKYAQAHGFPFKFDTLIWGSMHAAWLYAIGKVDQLAEITEWIRAVGERYPDCAMINVVNEPIHTKPAWRNALGGEGTTGWDWVIKSFQLARQYCSNSQLLINEYEIVNNPDTCRQYIGIINLLKAGNLLDGIGIQCHCFTLDNLDDSVLSECLNLLDETGLPLYVSELDLSGNDAAQLARYKDKFSLLYNHASVKGITLCGYIVGQTWKDQTGLVSSGSIGASERPAMQWLKPYLLSGSVPTQTPSPTPTQTPAGKLGDVNADNIVNIIDALLIAQYSAGLRPAVFITALADIDHNGSIQITDALLVARCMAGLGNCVWLGIS